MFWRPSLHMLPRQWGGKVDGRHFQVPLERQLFGLVLLLRIVLCKNLLIEGLTHGTFVQLLFQSTLFLVEKVLTLRSSDTQAIQILIVVVIFSYVSKLILWHLLLLGLLDLVDHEFLKLIIFFLLSQLDVKHMVDLAVKLLDQRSDELIIILISQGLVSPHGFNQLRQLFNLPILDLISIDSVIYLTLSLLL